ncbi:TetR/AcrR family transcriptional regulator, partial [Actinoallomurus acaciae]
STTPRPTSRPGGTRPVRRDEEVSSARIVATAISVADAEGLASVSMRRVAAELGMATMSMYRYVADKEDLLAQMMDAAFAEWPLPDDPPEGWRDRLEVAARTLWAMFRSHPWLAPALSVTRPQPVPHALPYTEWVLGSLDDLLDVQMIFTTHITLFNWVRATAINMESEAEAEALSGLDAEEWMDDQEPALRKILAAGRFPMFERLSREGYDFDLDGIFEFGLQRLLDGLAVFVGEAPR